MRIILVILGIVILITTGYAQNIKKILDKADFEKFKISDTVIKYVDKSDLKEGFSGNLLIKKIGRKYKSTSIGTWNRIDSKFGMDAIMVFDSCGRLLEYKEFNRNGSINFDCKYWYETKNEKYFRLENMVVSNDFGNIIIKGSRYWKVTENNFGFYEVSGKKKFGKWEYFDDDGNLTKIKEYGEIKELTN